MYSGNINLALARSYGPVCVCLLLVSLTCLAVVLLRFAGMESMPSYTIVACLLFFDNANRRHFIFNANFLPFFVLVSMIFNDNRAFGLSSDVRRVTVGVVLNIIWSFLSVMAVLQWETRFSVFRYVPISNLLVFCFFLCVHSFVYHPSEVEFVILLRACDFTILSITWMYLFCSGKMFFDSIFDCTPCVVQFGCLLFTAPVISFVTTVVFVIIFFAMTRNTQQCQGWCPVATTPDTYDHDSDIEGYVVNVHPVVTSAQVESGNEATRSAMVHVDVKHGALGLDSDVSCELMPSSVSGFPLDSSRDPTGRVGYTPLSLSTLSMDVHDLHRNSLVARQPRAASNEGEDIGEIRRLFEEAKRRHCKVNTA